MAAINHKTLREDEFFFGHKACAGCGASLVLRHVLKILGPNAVSVLPAGCMSAVGFNFPNLAFQNNSMISPFAATAPVMSGIRAGFDMRKKRGDKIPDDFCVVGFAGDGATADIGLAALSGTIDRDDNLLYICYDNEAYMNTGVQKSSLTPFGAKTTNTPVGTQIQGALSNKKNMFEIVAAHNISYAATASIGYLPDFLKKVAKAKDMPGTRYIHVIAPCPTGWGHADKDTINFAKAIVDCGLWYLAEYEAGDYKISRRPKEFGSIKDYLHSQSRFRALDDAAIAHIEAERDAKWAYIDTHWS